MVKVRICRDDITDDHVHNELMDEICGNKNLIPPIEVEVEKPQKEEWVAYKPIKPITTGEYRSRLKFFRELRGMSQSELAEKSGVLLRTIQAYEQGYKDINKAQVITVLSLAEALECDVYDIINDRI